MMRSDGRPPLHSLESSFDVGVYTARTSQVASLSRALKDHRLGRAFTASGVIAPRTSPARHVSCAISGRSIVPGFYIDESRITVGPRTTGA